MNGEEEREREFERERVREKQERRRATYLSPARTKEVTHVQVGLGEVGHVEDHGELSEVACGQAQVGLGDGRERTGETNGETLRQSSDEAYVEVVCVLVVVEVRPAL
jgi:hypothetical protein